MSTQTTWNDEGSQLTVRTDLGPAAAVRLAAFEADGRRFAIKNICKLIGHETTKWRDYVYAIGRKG